MLNASRVCMSLLENTLVQECIQVCGYPGVGANGSPEVRGEFDGVLENATRSKPGTSEMFCNCTGQGIRVVINKGSGPLRKFVSWFGVIARTAELEGWLGGWWLRELLAR